MSIASYSDLQASIQSRLGKRTDLSVTDYIAFGEARIYRELRVRQMESSFSSAISSGVIALPSSYRALKFSYVDGSPTQALLRKDAEWIYANYPTRSADGLPKHIAQEAGNLIFGPYPDAGYTVKGVYYKRLDALSNSNTSNWLITDAPDLILYASLIEAEADLVNDPRVPMWEAKYQQAKAAVQREADDEEFSGSILAATVR